MIDVKVGWEPKTFKAAQVMQVNPPKMEKFDDVSNMTYLNEASVLWNLKSRYVAKLIYVSFSLQIFNFRDDDCFFKTYFYCYSFANLKKSFSVDLFRSVLRGYQSVQALPYLHQ